jgi:hypothetical protein
MQATCYPKAMLNPPAKAWQQYRPSADPGSGLRINRGAGFDSIDVLLESMSCENGRVRGGGALVDFPFCGKSSVPNPRERYSPAQKLTAAQNSLDVAREQNSERKSPKQTWPESLRPACYASPFNQQQQRSVSTRTVAYQ